MLDSAGGDFVPNLDLEGSFMNKIQYSKDDKIL